MILDITETATPVACLEWYWCPLYARFTIVLPQLHRGLGGSAPRPSLKFFPINEIRPGLKGIGKTVFSGTAVEEFQVEILGVLENAGPKQSIILARLSGGPLERTGVMQGMSGSPVYINGRLAGAVAMAFPFSKEPIAGIRPIAEMLAGGDTGHPRAVQA